MSELGRIVQSMLGATVSGIQNALSGRNRRVTLAVFAGGLTIAAANWIAMNQSPGDSVIGLSASGASGAVFAPLYGGIVTGLVAGFNRRPLYADARAGTLAAFVGTAMLLVWTGIVRLTGELPGGGTGFERFGPISGIMFVLVVGWANVFIAFPSAFIVLFTSRSIVPNNRHRYGWVSDDEENPGIAYVTPGPPGDQPDLSSHSTAYSRFRQAPPRFSKVPRRFIDA